MLSQSYGFSVGTASKDVNLTRFWGWFGLVWGFFPCKIDTYPLGIELRNSYVYAGYQRVVSC